MTIDELLNQLSSEKVTLYLDGDRLRFRAAKGVLTNDLRVMIAENRVEIVRRLSKPGGTKPARCGYCEPRNWVDNQVNNSLIRTTCGKCGRFIGYRPKNIVASVKMP